MMSCLLLVQHGARIALHKRRLSVGVFLLACILLKTFQYYISQSLSNYF